MIDFGRFVQITDQYFVTSVLSKLPEPLAKYDPKSGKIMDPQIIEEPSLKHQVCCYVMVEDLGDIEIDPRIGLSISLKKGDIYRLPFTAIRQLVHDFKVLLL